MNSGSQHIFFGVDGGGSGCRVAVCDLSGRKLAEVVGGPANYTTDPNQTIANLREAVARAAGEASLDEGGVRRSVAHLGLAGVLTKAHGEALASALPFAFATVSDDRETSVAGALGDASGAVASIGTGSFVGVRHGDDTRFFGGWGLRLGDQASGAWLGRAALEQYLLVNDGLDDRSEFIRTISARFAGGPVEVVAFTAGARPGDLAALAPEIIDAARDGDPVAMKLMRRGAAYIDACLAAADLRPDDVVCLTGGVGPHYTAYLREEYRSRLHPPRGSALDGALELARALHERLGLRP